TSARVASSASAPLASSATAAPCSANALAVARPTPEVAPVTTTESGRSPISPAPSRVGWDSVTDTDIARTRHTAAGDHLPGNSARQPTSKDYPSTDSANRCAGLVTTQMGSCEREGSLPPRVDLMSTGAEGNR